MQLRLSLVEHKKKSGHTDVIVLRQAQRGRWDIASLESVLMHNPNLYASDLAASRHFENLDPLDLEKREGFSKVRVFVTMTVGAARRGRILLALEDPKVRGLKATTP